MNTSGGTLLAYEGTISRLRTGAALHVIHLAFKFDQHPIITEYSDTIEFEWKLKEITVKLIYYKHV